MMREKDNLKYLLNIAQQAAVATGKFLVKRSLSATTINSETRWDVKIHADKQSEKRVIDFLQKKTDFSIISEESEAVRGNNKQYTWIIDPLDGTLNYFRGLPICCVSIGLWKVNEPVLGVIYDFNHNEIFSGIAKKGAWCNGKKIEASTINKKDKAVICTGFPISSDFSTKGLFAFSKKIQRYKKIRLIGSAALSIAYVSAGRADVYMEDNIMIWDIAAGIAIAKAAGCKIDIRPGGRDNAFYVTVSNGRFDTHE